MSMNQKAIIDILCFIAQYRIPSIPGTYTSEQRKRFALNILYKYKTQNSFFLSGSIKKFFNKKLS